MGCGEVRPKRALVRLALDGDLVVVDPQAIRGGRGAYVCDDACYARALARRALPRAFRRAVRPAGNSLESIGS